MYEQYEEDLRELLKRHDEQDFVIDMVLDEDVWVPALPKADPEIEAWLTDVAYEGSGG